MLPLQPLLLNSVTLHIPTLDMITLPVGSSSQAVLVEGCIFLLWKVVSCGLRDSLQL